MKFSFQPLQPTDYAQFARWLGEPHVAKWWREPATVEHVEKEYGPSDDKTDVYVIVGDDKPVGIMQSYLVDDYPEHSESVQLPGGVGVDILIGDPDLIGKGYGTQMVQTFIDEVVRLKYSRASGVVADPEVENGASVRMFEKAGFTKGAIVPGEYGPEQLMYRQFN